METETAENPSAALTNPPLWRSVGPLHSDRQYDISASKEGFVLSPVEGTQGDFKAFALAGVTFTVRRPFNVQAAASFGRSAP